MTTSYETNDAIQSRLVDLRAIANEVRATKNAYFPKMADIFMDKDTDPKEREFIKSVHHTTGVLSAGGYIDGDDIANLLTYIADMLAD